MVEKLVAYSVDSKAELKVLQTVAAMGQCWVAY